MKNPENRAVLPEKTVRLAMAVLAAIAAGTTSGVTYAGFYGGLGYLGSEVDPRVNQSGFVVTDDRSFGGQIFLGADIGNRLSVEGYYADLGEASLSNINTQSNIEYKSAGVAGLFYLFSSEGWRGLFDREGLLFYGRAGYGYLDNSSDTIEFRRLKSTHLAAGLGAEYNFNNGFGVRAEFHNLDADARAVSISVLKRFGKSSVKELSELEPIPIEEEPFELAEKVEPATSHLIQETPEPAAELVAKPEPMVIPTPDIPVTADNAPAAPGGDDDGDGVTNNADLCVGTLADAEVNVNGCVYSGVIQDLNFNTNAASLTPSATTALDAAIAEYSANPSLRLVVKAHTDNRGDARNNMALSRLRAETVVRYLADVGGIDLGRMSAIGYGESHPIVSNKTPEGRFANRRVAIEIVGHQ